MKSSPSSRSPARKRTATLQSPPSTKRLRRGEPAAGPSKTPAPTSRYKRAHGSSPVALNAEFEINPTANAGVPFAFDEVVRGRQHRHALGAGDCEECREWYAAIGPLPPRLEAPRWNSPSPPPAGEPDSASVHAHRQAVSRHRAQWARAPTPPGYWDIGFPDTQAVQRINEKATEMHRQKRAAVAQEVRKGSGRYRRRDQGAGIRRV
ncbi:hypothetical protein BC834DRAFT_922125 [Gloeopeniophorella convolvens]|nr:hypothetical protein BC834DRAFT_922125 [Gloeopeniophorella convolvens]